MSRQLEPALVALGMPVPASRVAADARHVLETSEPPFLANHSLRSYAFAVALAQVDSREFDPEILYVAAVLHDIALVPAFDVGGCFEFDGARAARKIARYAGVPVARASAIAEAIERHMAADRPKSSIEAALLWDSTGVDVTGYRFDEIPDELVRSITEAYPRLGFKTGFARAFIDQAIRKPRCRVADMVASGALDRIAAAPFAE